MNRALFLLPLLTLVVLAGFFGWSLVSGRDPASIGSVMVGRPAPTLPLAEAIAARRSASRCWSISSPAGARPASPSIRCSRG